ncbi:hypothetical protein [Acidovorax sp. 106]|uniref:hypothetical protein n=1 Tax=Acidovorax sp. 106 TaxID=2135637 RepID=UPI000EAFD0C5|nr:hypothetical protein [Acidovorax sp. 106]RLJ36452.1 hypothetical protein C8C98_0126 [Acidovorax sp. 106]
MGGALGGACLALACSGAAASGSAPGTDGSTGPWSVSGHLMSQLRARLDDGHAMSATQRAWIETQWQSGPVSLLASGYVDWDPLASYRSSTVRTRLHELTLGTYAGDWRIDAGRRRLRWGAADGRSVLDLINPVDLSDPFVGGMRNTTRLPSWMATVEREALGGRLQMVWVPRAGVGRLPESGSPWEPSVLRQQREAAGAAPTRVETPARPEYGLRWIRYGNGFDIEMLAYQGHAREPLSLGDGRFAAPAVRTFGMAVQGVLGGNGLRGEMAWEPHASLLQAATGALGRSPRLRAVLGWDRQFDDGPYANLQAYFDHQAASPLSRGRSQRRHGLTYLVRDRFMDSSLEIGARGVLQTSDRSGSAELYAQWEVDDQWRLDAGVMRLWGRPTSEYGLWRGQSSFRISARRSF